MGKPIPIGALAGSSAPAQAYKNKIVVVVYDKYGFIRRYKHIPIRRILNKKEIRDYKVDEIYISKIPTLSSPFLTIILKIREKA
jgi:hypothetical protein